MINTIDFNNLLLLAKQRKTMVYYYQIHRHHQCFTGNYQNDMLEANSLIDSIPNDATAHGKECALK
jgi:hypothetical protein